MKNVDELYKDGQRHIVLVLLRVVLTFLLAQALPTAHMEWGQPYPGDGQQALGFILIFGMISASCAASSFCLGCLVHYLLRKRAVAWTIGFDVTVALILGGLLVHMGMTAKHVDAETASKVPQTLRTRVETSRDCAVAMPGKVALRFSSLREALLSAVRITALGREFGRGAAGYATRLRTSLPSRGLVRTGLK